MTAINTAAILLYGPPAAGKSSLARELLTHYRATVTEPPMLYLSTDALRETISGKSYLSTARTVVYDGVLAMVCSALAQGHHVLIDGNYLDSEQREELIKAVAQTGARLLKVLVSCPVELALKRNGGRLPGERVPEEYLRDVFSRVEAARPHADVNLDSQESLMGAEGDILTWLLGIPPQAPVASNPIEEWTALGQRRWLKAGEAIWRVGQACTEAILLLEGELEVVREQLDQPPVVINRLNAGDLAGDLSSLDGSLHSATLRASCASVIVSLSSNHFRSLLRRDPALLDRVLSGMAQRIRALSGKASEASIDLLTGLGNRRMLEDLWPHLEAAAVRETSPLTVALFDVDRFKAINDTFGHQVGDVVLREIGTLLKESIPEPGICLRYGGDEFVIFLPGYSNRSALNLLENFAQRVRSTPMALNEGLQVHASVSVGFATYPEPVVSTSVLFAKADEAAYVSKAQGRDRVTSWNGTGKDSASS